MRSLHSIPVFVLILLVFGLAAAQDKPTETKPSPTPEKDKARLELEAEAIGLADSAAVEANSLKLWENRALVYALAGDMIWASDQKRARQLFRNAANELTAGNTVPKEKPKDYFEDYSWWEDFSPRRSVLLIIATYDPDWALELLLETRPAELQAAINTQNQPPIGNSPVKTQAQSITDQKNKFKIQRELELEQGFAAKAAEQNPEKAAKLIRESLKKGVSEAAFGLVQKVSQKDQKLGKELLDEIVQKILASDFKQSENSTRVAGFLLFQASSPEIMKAENPKFKPLKLEDKQLKDIAAKIADFYLQQTDFRGMFEMNMFMPTFEKYVPEKIPLLKQKETAFKKLMPAEMSGFSDANKLINDPAIKPEKLIEEAEKFSGYQKLELYRAAVNKLIDAGQGEKARELIQNTPDSKQRDDILTFINETLSAKAISDDKLDDVQKIIAKTESDSSKVKILVDLAVGFEKKKTKETHETAAKLMDDARRLVSGFPESSEDVDDILKLASGYAAVEPDKAFPYLTTMIEMTNDLLTAKSLLSKYNKRNVNFKQGELIFTNSFGYNVGGYTKYGKELGLLAAADFGRTKGLIDQFRRDDVRVLVKIMLAQSILKEKIGADGVTSFSTEEF
jgi:hypothetical protein